MEDDSRFTLLLRDGGASNEFISEFYSAELEDASSKLLRLVSLKDIVSKKKVGNSVGRVLTFYHELMKANLDVEIKESVDQAKALVNPEEAEVAVLGEAVSLVAKDCFVFTHDITTPISFM